MAQSAMQVNQCAWGLETGTQDLESHPGKGLLWLCGDGLTEQVQEDVEQVQDDV